jgi:hypothetical protein
MRIGSLLRSMVCCIALGASSVAQQVGGSPAAAASPTHPITETTLRRYFEACHFDVRNREALEVELEAQRLKLPAWYPKEIWDEIEKSVEEIDVASVALPVYQKYLSEEVGRNAILLFVTPEGQAMIKKVYDTAIQRESFGDSATEARRKALAAVRNKEDAKVHAMLDSMTPEQHRAVEAFVRSTEWQRFNALSGQVTQEFASVYVVKQQLVADQITQDHKADFEKAIREYRLAHPEENGTTQK